MFLNLRLRNSLDAAEGKIEWDDLLEVAMCYCEFSNDIYIYTYSQCNCSNTTAQTEVFPHLAHCSRTMFQE